MFKFRSGKPWVSLLDNTVDSDATVGTDCRACGAAYTLLRILVGRKMVSPVVDFLGLKSKHIAGTCHNAEIASFATLPVDFYSSYNFCHID